MGHLSARKKDVYWKFQAGYPDIGRICINFPYGNAAPELNPKESAAKHHTKISSENMALLVLRGRQIAVQTVRARKRSRLHFYACVAGSRAEGTFLRRPELKRCVGKWRRCCWEIDGG